jgi:hypothetical protein
MRCETFEQRMHTLLDNRQRPELDDQLRAHVAVCPACQEQLESQESLFAGLELMDVPESRGEFADAVVKDVAQGDRRRYFQWAVIAAAVLVIAGLTPFLSGTSSEPDPSHLVNQPADPQENQSPITGPNAISTPDLIGPNKSVGGDYLVSFAFSQVDQLPDSIEKLDSVGLAKGLRPLARSFNSAYDVILRAIPVLRDDRSGSPQAEFSLSIGELTA